MWCRRAVVGVVIAGCTHGSGKTTPSTVTVTAPSMQPGACGEPGRDGVMGASPHAERQDFDLDGDGTPEIVVVDRAMCTPRDADPARRNCYWNVFAAAARPGECARYLGTFEGYSLAVLATRGDNNMSDVRATWNLTGGRMLLQSYRFARGGYQIVDVLQCKQATDDRLVCADTDR